MTEAGGLARRFEDGFVNEDQLEQFAGTILEQVRATDILAGRARAGVVDGLMHTMQALNIIHPFREGNGRTQRILTEHIAEHAGYLLDWYRISPEEQNRTMALSFEGEMEPLHDALERALLPMIPGGSVDASPWPTEPTRPARAPNFWKLAKPGEQVLADSRAQQAAQPPEHGSPTRTAPALDKQNDRGR